MASPLPNTNAPALVKNQAIRHKFSELSPATVGSVSASGKKNSAFGVRQARIKRGGVLRSSSPPCEWSHPKLDGAVLSAFDSACNRPTEASPKDPPDRR